MNQKDTSGWRVLGFALVVYAVAGFIVALYPSGSSSGYVGLVAFMFNPLVGFVSFAFGQSLGVLSYVWPLAVLVTGAALAAKR